MTVALDVIARWVMQLFQLITLANFFCRPWKVESATLDVRKRKVQYVQQMGSKEWHWNSVEQILTGQSFGKRQFEIRRQQV